MAACCRAAIGLGPSCSRPQAGSVGRGQAGLYSRPSTRCRPQRLLARAGDNGKDAWENWADAPDTQRLNGGKPGGGGGGGAPEVDWREEIRGLGEALRNTVRARQCVL